MELFRKSSSALDSSPYNMNQEPPKKKNNKTGAKIVLGVLIAGFIGELIYLNLDQPPAPVPAPSPAPVVKKSQAEPKDSTETFNLAQVYPFWTEGMDKAVAEQVKTDTSAPAPSPKISGKVPRPNIPDLPSSMPLPSGSGGLMPAIPHEPSGRGSAHSGDLRITGLILGYGASDSVAILSDGSVVQEGQKYNGNTVSSISENGITFEDGSRMNYK